ncbi:conserved hypothetical protein [Ricinus communis]|uniref:Uncharacterized protein n=1 Tax=Ricinus communis TaxID=3988 RepID=B9SN13_RICCO|nr:conserved hypothetical protein [Ricinus communis]
MAIDDPQTEVAQILDRLRRIIEEEKKRYQVIASKEVVSNKVPSRHSFRQLGIEKEVKDGIKALS